MYMQQHFMHRPIKREEKEEVKHDEVDEVFEEDTLEYTKYESEEESKNKTTLDEEILIEELLTQPTLIESIWHYVAETTAQYTSIFSFIDESIPKLKKIQLDDMNRIFDNRIQTCKKRLYKNFVRNSLKELK